MIRLQNISKSIIDEHWSYFINSNGYKKINDYASDNSLREAERDIYIELSSTTNLLENLICGDPKTLIDCIAKLDALTNKLPELRFSQLPRFKAIYDKVNTKNGLSKKERKNNKIKILKELIRIDNLCKKEGVYSVKKYNGNISDVSRKKITIKEIEYLYKSLKSELEQLRGESYERINEVFDYTSFTQSFDSWGAYSLTRELSVSVCPYCNRNYVNTVETESGKTRPQLDHFYPKSRFPFLQLSIYNLIPSCYICNANFKGSIDFYSEKHIHPYLDDLIDDIIFFIDVDNAVLGEAVPNKDDFEIKVKSTTDNKDRSVKINNSINTFKLEQLYNEHKDIAREILEKAVYYNETRIQELVNFFNDKNSESNKLNPPNEALKLDEKTKRFIIGNYIENPNLNKRTLAKFMKDIALNTELKKFI